MFIICTVIWLQHVSAGIGHGFVIRIPKNNKDECSVRRSKYKWDLILRWTYDFKGIMCFFYFKRVMTPKIEFILLRTFGILYYLTMAYSGQNML